MRIEHPEGRVVAVQQQMFFAHLLSEQMDISAEVILRKLAMAGLCLVTDINEVALDAAAILPNLNQEKTKLRPVPDMVDKL
jgi:hypothetical protein